MARSRFTTSLGNPAGIECSSDPVTPIPGKNEDQLSPTLSATQPHSIPTSGPSRSADASPRTLLLKSHIQKSFSHHQVCVQVAAVEPWSAWPVRKRQPHPGGQHSLRPLDRHGEGGAAALPPPSRAWQLRQRHPRVTACVRCGKRAAVFRPRHHPSLSQFQQGS